MIIPIVHTYADATESVSAFIFQWGQRKTNSSGTLQCPSVKEKNNTKSKYIRFQFKDSKFQWISHSQDHHPSELSMTRAGTNKLMNKCERALAHCWCYRAGKRLDYNPRTPSAIKLHLLYVRHGPVFFLVLPPPLYSDSSRALCCTIYHVFRTDSLVGMQNTHSHHLGSSWASEQNGKVQTCSTTSRWTNRPI